MVNDQTYNHGSYLADVIYPKGPTFVNAILYLSNKNKEKYYKVQESTRKYVRRTFDVLKLNGVLFGELNELINVIRSRTNCTFVAYYII